MPCTSLGGYICLGPEVVAVHVPPRRRLIDLEQSHLCIQLGSALFAAHLMHSHIDADPVSASTSSTPVQSRSQGSVSVCESSGPFLASSPRRARRLGDAPTISAIELPPRTP
ncbi:hypothetical protein BV25DRAFT_1827554 [Artomyces pyxidatus]|uniref:Uncharacterized protein n=1 Tax=Artomyces pyxidatus TaxID=48021 RepID=A0ACB8SX07_9AGAM|nr:hypothetical protein BV25DRAFT_1827554 [Artomyces pyxidatus]